MADDGNKFFSFSINSDQIMATLKNQSAQVEQDLAESAAKLAQMARSKIVELANHDLQGWHRETFMGPGGSNIKLTEAGKNIYVVEIDESVMGYDRGLPRRSMLTDKWLLKNAKTAADGSRYAIIPFKHDLRGGSHEGDSALNAQARAAVQAARTPDNKRINLKAIEKNPDGTPRIGLLHKINVTPPFSQKQAPHLFSKPRSAEDAAKTGLQQHEGIYKLQGLAISQRMVGNKVKREAVTFRVASSKQASEDRWMAPAIAPGKFLERTVQWMSQEAWPQILQELQSRYS